MLHADKNALEQTLRVQMLNLQWRELEYLHTNFQNLATSSAVLIGFGFAAFGLTSNFHPEAATRSDSVFELGVYHWSSWYFLWELIFETLFLASAGFGVAFNLLSLFIATTSNMCGPGMALRGPEGSISVSVRHLEQQLKRALRFFGRGLVAFICSIITINARRLQSIAFVGGIVGGLVGLWCLVMMWQYGADIAEKFYVSPGRAVRGVFVQGADGTERWMNTPVERAQRGVVPGWYCCGFEFGRRSRRWRPEGHGFTTPLWRLDKMIAFPYLDSNERIGRCIGDGGDAARERQQLHNLVINAQGPIGSFGGAGGDDMHPDDLLGTVFGLADDGVWDQSGHSGSSGGGGHGAGTELIGHRQGVVD
jgi:hypothetical protein